MSNGGDGVPSEALVTCREGVVGAWQPIGTVDPLEAPNPAALDYWDAVPRLFILESELTCGLSFDTGNQSVALSFRDKAATAHAALMHMIRPTADDFKKQLDYVRNYAVLRMERATEIEAQIAGVAPFIGSACGLRPNRHPRTLELLNVILNVTKLVEMRIKHELLCRRPDQYSPQIQPMIQTPGHGSLPSGHSTESFVMALLFDELRRAAKASGATYPARNTSDPVFIQLMRIAERMAINRTIAGVHFPVDSAAGMVLACTLSEYFIARFAGLGSVYSRTFDGRGFDSDFAYGAVWDQAQQACAPTSSSTPSKICRSDTPVTIPGSTLLNHLWSKAVAEWK